MPASNRDRAIEFLKLASSGNIDEAYARYVSPQFKHHNFHFKGDAESLKRGMKDSFTQFPNKQLEVKRALEDGEHVAVHLCVRLTPDGRDIAELWEATEMAPETPINENDLF